MRAPRVAFSTGGTLALVVAGYALFLAFVWLIAAGDSFGGDGNNGEAHAGAKGLNGYTGLVRLVRATREHAELTVGASPRVAVLLAGAARARAALEGRDYVIPDDVKALAVPVLRHRLTLSPAAEIEGRDMEALVAELVESTEAPR